MRVFSWTPQSTAVLLGPTITPRAQVNVHEYRGQCYRKCYDRP